MSALLAQYRPNRAKMAGVGSPTFHDRAPANGIIYRRNKEVTDDQTG